VALTAVSLVFILFWNENTGDHTNSSGDGDLTFSQSVGVSLRTIRSSPAILCIGLSQAFFEGAIFSFGKN
jgi:hypothetical protein